MATTKSSSTAKKSTSTSTAPKKPRAPKPVVEKTEETPEVDPFIVEETPKPKPVKAVENLNEKIKVFIPLDPSEQERVQYIDGSDNGRFFHLQRGKEHELERGFAEYILFRIKTARELEEYVEEKRYKG